MGKSYLDHAKYLLKSYILSKEYLLDESSASKRCSGLSLRLAAKILRVMKKKQAPMISPTLRSCNYSVKQFSYRCPC